MTFDAPPAGASGMPVLEAERARIAIDGAVAIEGATFATRGPRVVCAGTALPLMAALTGVPLAAHRRDDDGAPAGEARVTAGALRVAGRDVAQGEHYVIAGIAPLDPPLPPRFTARDYVEWGARVMGVAARHARDLAASALERAGLAAVARRAVTALSVPERRALVLASAAATTPGVLIADAPLAGLDAHAAAFVFRAFAALAEDRAAIVRATRLDPGSPEGGLARAATDLVVLAGGELVVAAPPEQILATASIYTVRVRANTERFRDELASRGIAVRGGPDRLALALPEGITTRDVLRAATAAAAPVVELAPLI